MLPTSRERLRQGESVRFPVQGKGAIDLSARGIVVMFGNKQEEIPKEAIAGASIAMTRAGIWVFGISTRRRQITISKVGAKKGFLGIGQEGMLTFPYANLGNAHLFLTLLNEVIQQKTPTEPDQSAEPATELPDSPTTAQ